MSIVALADNPLALGVGLFLVSLVHEETAMIGGGYLISEHALPADVVTLVLILGLITGDWGVYGLGAAARRVPRLRRWVGSDAAHRSRDWLADHLLLVIVVARLFPGPGILFPTFSGLGLIGVSFGRFAIRSAMVAVVYAPAMLYLLTLYGKLVIPNIGWWGWPALIVVSTVGFGGPWARPLRRRAADFIGMNRSAGVASTKPTVD